MNFHEFGGRKGKISKETRKEGVQEKKNSLLHSSFPGFLMKFPLYTARCTRCRVAGHMATYEEKFRSVVYSDRRV